MNQNNAEFEINQKKCVDDVIKQLISCLVQMGNYAKNNVSFDVIDGVKKQIIETITRFCHNIRNHDNMKNQFSFSGM